MRKSNFIYFVGGAFLVIGLLLVLLHKYPSDWPYNSLVNAFYANFSAEFISIAITILLVDYIYDKREEVSNKKRLIRELGSEDRGFASRALKELKEMGSLTDGSLKNVDLSKANLSGLDFSNANLEGVNFENAKLDSVIFKGANLTSAILTSASLREANLEECNLSNAIMKRCNLYAARLNNAKLVDVDLMSSNLERCELTDSTIHNSKLEDSILLLASLKRAKLTNCILLRVDLNSATIKYATFERCDLKDLKNWDQMAEYDNSKFIACLNIPNGLTTNN